MASLRVPGKVPGYSLREYNPYRKSEPAESCEHLSFTLSQLSGEKKSFVSFAGKL